MFTPSRRWAFSPRPNSPMRSISPRRIPRSSPATAKASEKFQRDGAPKMIENFCIARRLVEAGARFVALNYSRWDWHGGDGMNYPRSREEFPLLDQGLSALVTDLHERGLDKDVSVVVWGEFGRTPKINQNNSRDHWPKVSCAMLAGGGMRTGQVIGQTNRYGEYAPGTPRQVPGSLRHAVPQHRPGPQRHPHLRRRRHPALPRRSRHRTDPRSDLKRKSIQPNLHCRAAGVVRKLVPGIVEAEIERPRLRGDEGVVRAAREHLPHDLGGGDGIGGL